MTDLDQLIHTLPMQSKLALLQIWANPATMAPPTIDPKLSVLIHQGLVNITDGRASISRRGAVVIRALDTERQIATCDRFLRIVENVLACGGEVANLEQAFSEPSFTVDELDLLAVGVEQLRAAIAKARGQ